MRFYSRFFVSLIMLLCLRLPAQALNEEPEQLLPRRDSPLAKALHTLTIPQLQQAMDAGTLSAEAMVSFYLAQIQHKNPKLKAVIAVNPHAMQLAKTLDKERAAGKLRGPLHGIAVAIKDNIETSEMPTTAGSLALKDNITGRDAPLVGRLKAAGAIIIAKTNLSEWANFRSERSSSGWSAVAGQTRNPHDLSRSPCGSSSGSAVVVAANLAVVAIGTETNGSITCPAAINGVVGIKPTLGLVSRTHIVPISQSQDTAGPLAKSVADAALVLAVIRGRDNIDPATHLQQPEHFTTQLNPSEQYTLKGRRIGVLTSPAMEHEAVNTVFKSTTTLLQQQGATLISGLSTQPYDGLWTDSYEVLLYEFKHGVNRYLAQLPSALNTLNLAKLIVFNKQNASLQMPFFQQEIFEKAQIKGPLSEPAYRVALEKVRRATREEGIDQLMTQHQLDFIITPTIGPAWKIDRLNGDHFSGSFSSYPAIAGYPHLTMPMGYVAHLPVGLSITGPAFSEARIIAAARAIEGLLDMR